MSKAIKDYNSVDWKSLFTYDPSVPTGLRWKADRMAGRWLKIKAATAGSPAGNVHKGAPKYKACTVPHSGTNWFTARIIWIIHNGELSNDLVVDHIDGNTLNNDLANLRVVNQVLNNRNASKRKDNVSGTVGVHFTEAKDNKGGKYLYATSTWYSSANKSKNKHFSVSKLGLLPAFAEAVKFRKGKIDELNAQGFGYTNDHGQ